MDQLEALLENGQSLTASQENKAAKGEKTKKEANTEGTHIFEQCNLSRAASCACHLRRGIQSSGAAGGGTNGA